MLDEPTLPVAKESGDRSARAVAGLSGFKRDRIELAVAVQIQEWNGDRAAGEQSRLIDAGRGKPSLPVTEEESCRSKEIGFAVSVEITSGCD